MRPADGARRHASRLARSFARRPIDARTSSSQTKRTSSAMRSTILVSRPFSTNARLEITVRTPAVRHADSIPAAPVEMFSRQGTTPNACSPMNATTEAIALGISSATCVSPAAMPASARPSAAEPTTTRS